MRTLCIKLAAVLAIPLVAAPVCSQEPVPGLEAIGAGASCFVCHGNPGLRKELPAGRSFSLYINRNDWKKSAHAKAGLGCEVCHGEKPHLPADQTDTLGDWQKFQTEHREACGGCHSDQRDQFAASVHARSSNPNAPNTCVDCHNPHKAGLTTRTRVDTVKTCGRCHPHARETYFRSIHGQNLALGNEKVAACFDCHGYHNVKAVRSDGFTGKELAAICSRCHKGVKASAVSGWYSHAPVTAFQRFILSSTTLFYIIIIPLTLASMLAHQFLKHRRIVQRRRIRRQAR